jgi:predicted O-methyltransferase YrrM
MDRELLQEKLDRAAIPSSILLGRTKMYDESSRTTGAYSDPRHFPFYYYLGQQLQPKSVLQVGTYLGLPAVCFLQGCKTVEEWCCVGETSTISMKNIRQHHRSASSFSWERAFEDERMWDLALLTQDFSSDDSKIYLNFLWERLASEGLLVMDYISSSDVVFHDFCRVKNREPVFFTTRYTIGIVQK